jgi:hypothetical protein
MPRYTRRELAALLAVSPLTARNTPPTPAQPTAIASTTSPDKAADEVRRASEELRALNMPMNIEPAFIFKV